MKAKVISYGLLLVMGIFVLWFNYKDKVAGNANAPRSNNTIKSRNHGFDRNTSFIEYTKHAKCRMDCRNITQSEVEDIMKNGSINYRKSNINDRPCPSYALEGYTLADNQHVRIVFAQCDHNTKVVTCIDLDNEFTCDCH
jgi:ABC-type nickel/cobalt efflux system permease component RcnA